MNFNKNNTWISADAHFGHYNIIKLCNRNFDDDIHMNSRLTDNWNSVVRPDDNVIHLGDFAFRGNSADTYIKNLNGNIWFVLGNHDKDLKKFFGDAIVKHFNGKTYRILPPETMINIDNQYIVLSHYSMRSWDGQFHGVWQLYGHSHGKLKDDPNALSIDVGVDCHNFYPINFNQIKAIMDNKHKRRVFNKLIDKLKSIWADR